jgi:hypothetical protein
MESDASVEVVSAELEHAARNMVVAVASAIWALRGADGIADLLLSKAFTVASAVRGTVVR